MATSDRHFDLALDFSRPATKRNGQGVNLTLDTGIFSAIQAMTKAATDAGFPMFAGFIALRHFDQLGPISTVFDRQLTPVLTPK